MNFRPVGALALVLATVVGAPAHAASKPKTPCQWVKDEKNDTFLARAAEGNPNNPQEPGLDITSADLASDGKTVTAVIRIAKWSPSVQTAPLGYGFAFTFLPPLSNMEASLRAVFITGQAPYYEATYRDPSVPNGPSTFLSLATGSVNTAKGEIHISAPATAFAPIGLIKKGAKLFPGTDTATSGRAVPPTPGTAGQPTATRMVFSDAAATGKPYTVGAPSCVVPGK
jgi:hypothetical protein